MLAVIFFIGLLIGIAITVVIIRKHVVGTLRVDQSDPGDQPYLFLEMGKDLNAIYRKKYVLMKVKIQNYLSHK